MLCSSEHGVPMLLSMTLEGRLKGARHSELLLTLYYKHPHVQRPCVKVPFVPLHYSMIIAFPLEKPG